MGTTVNIALFLVTFSSPVLAWDGYNSETGEYITIESGTLVRSGEDIDVYNQTTGEYQQVEVESVGNGEIEVYNYGTGERQSYDMD